LQRVVNPEPGRSRLCASVVIAVANPLGSGIHDQRHPAIPERREGGGCIREGDEDYPAVPCECFAK
jgi:hypothetical protein